MSHKITSSELRLKIFEMHQEGVKNHEIANEVGLSEPTVSKIIREEMAKYFSEYCENRDDLLHEIFLTHMDTILEERQRATALKKMGKNASFSREQAGKSAERLTELMGLSERDRRESAMMTGGDGIPTITIVPMDMGTETALAIMDRWRDERALWVEARKKLNSSVRYSESRNKPKMKRLEKSENEEKDGNVDS